jgi:hypothetical protein
MTPRLELPLLTEGQGSAEILFNTLAFMLDMLIGAGVSNTAGGLTAPTSPPGSPADGVTYIVPASATGAWTGKTGYVTGFYNGQWLFAKPVEGLRVRHLADNVSYWYSGSAWTVVTSGSATGIG